MVASYDAKPKRYRSYYIKIIVRLIIKKVRVGVASAPRLERPDRHLDRALQRTTDVPVLACGGVVVQRNVHLELSRLEFSLDFAFGPRYPSGKLSAKSPPGADDERRLRTTHGFVFLCALDRHDDVVCQSTRAFVYDSDSRDVSAFVFVEDDRREGATRSHAGGGSLAVRPARRSSLRASRIFWHAASNTSTSFSSPARVVTSKPSFVSTARAVLTFPSRVFRVVGGRRLTFPFRTDVDVRPSPRRRGGGGVPR